MTAQQSNYHNANAAFELQQDTATAIANLATATAAGRATFSNLTATNSILTNELAQTNASLTGAEATIKALKFELAMLKKGDGNNNNSNYGNNNGNYTRNYTPNQNYCHTHGDKVNRSHTSATCTRPANGHKRDATRTNNMGG